MLLDFVQSLYAYNTWANQRVLETATPISTADFLTATHVTHLTQHDATKSHTLIP